MSNRECGISGVSAALSIQKTQKIWYTEKKEVIGMTYKRVWEKAQDVALQVATEILPGFDIGFDKRIPCKVQEARRARYEKANTLPGPDSHKDLFPWILQQLFL